jgi:hypothetical protein
VVAAFPEHDLVDLCRSSVLLLEVEVELVQLLGLLLRDVLQAELEDLPGPVVLPQLDLELREVQEVLLLQRFRPQLGDHSFVYAPRRLFLPIFKLELGHLEVAVEDGVRFQEVVQHFLRLLRLAHAFLEPQKRHPGLFAGAPLHPAGEDAPRLHVLAEQFLHIGVLEPELVLARQVVDCAFPDVPGVVDELVLHLHLGVLQPQALVGVVDLEGAFEDRPRPVVFLEVFLPLAVAHPHREVVALSPQLVLELPALLLLVDVQFLLVHDALDWRAQGDRAVDLRVFEDLVRGYLDCSRLLVLDWRRSHLDLRHSLILL